MRAEAPQLQAMSHGDSGQQWGHISGDSKTSLGLPWG